MRWLQPRAERFLGWPLPATAEDVPDIDVLAERLRRSPLPLRRLRRKIRFRRDGYSRRVLFRNDACELVLACWLPGQASAIHDHGGAFGAVRVIRGTLCETEFAWRGNLLRPIRRTRCVEGDVTIERPETIHRVENTSTEGAVTLHLYTPPIRAMTRMDTGSEVPPSWTLPADAALAI